LYLFYVGITKVQVYQLFYHISEATFCTGFRKNYWK